MLSFSNISRWQKPAVIAHRGASFYLHENTINAFKKAIELGADAIELDVRQTSDNVLMVHHDSFNADIGRHISDITHDEIKKFNSKSLYQIPTFADVCAVCSDRIALNIELKESGYEKDVVDTALQYFQREHLLFSSFNRKTIETIKHLDRQNITGYLLGGRFGVKFFKDLFCRFSMTADFDIILPHYSLCRMGFLRRIEYIHKPVIVWTVDKLWYAKKLIKKGVKGIITNDPGEIKF